MYQLINVSGADADDFLQGQLTQDIGRLTSNTALLSAWCSPKGRVVATMKIIRSDDGIDLLMADDIAGPLLQRISIYKMRADVTMAPAINYCGVAVQSAADLQTLRQRDLLPTELNACRRSDQLTSVCIASDAPVIEIFGLPEAVKKLALQGTLTHEQWRTTLIRSGLVQINAENSEKYTPHMLSLDLAGAISFDKGCYTGQEIVARTEHRGRSRRRLARYQCDAADIASGDELLDGDKAVGTVVNASSDAVLAVTPVNLHSSRLSLNGKVAVPVKLPWQ